MDVVEDRGKAAKGVAVDIYVNFVIPFNTTIGKENENIIVVAVISTARDVSVNVEAEKGDTLQTDN